MSITIETRNESCVKTNKQTLFNNILNVLQNESKHFNDEGHANGLTAREIASKMYHAGLIRENVRGSVHPRLTELVDAGKIIVTGKKYDQYTDRNVAMYAIKKQYSKEEDVK